MAGLTLNASHAGTPTSSDKLFRTYSKLPPEILIMVFEDLLDSHSSISSLRLVSKQFNDLVLPISYRRVVLNCRIVDFNSCDLNYETASSYKLQVKRDVSRYAQHIMIKQNFHKKRLQKLLLSLASFRSLTISYRGRRTAPDFSRKTGGSTMSPAPSMDAFLLHLARFRKIWPTLRIYIENLETQKWQMPQVETLPDSQVLSLKIEEWYEGHADPELDGLEVKKLLLSMKQMKVLHLKAFESEATISNSDLSAADRLPALEELVLHGYDWQFSAITAVTFWDWTKITHLELKRVTILPFLRTVPPENLLHLKTFVSDSFCVREPLNWDETNGLLCKLVRLILSPEKLGIRINRGLHDNRNIDSMTNCVRAIATHGQSLRFLDLQGHWSRDDDRYKDLVRDWKKDLLTLQSCQNLTELTLDDGVLALQVQQDFTADTLTKFRNLRRLTVSASFFGDMHRESQQETVEKTQSDALAWIERLLANKQGAEFEELSLDIAVFHKRSPDMTVPLITHCGRCGFWRDTKPKRVIRLTYGYEDGDQRIWETKSLPRGLQD